MAASQQQPNGALPLPPPQSPQQFCLRWNNYQTNLTNVFDQLLQSESFVDVTLACEGHSVKAHKMVLSACSPYFQSLFFDNPCQHPIVILKDIKWTELKAAVEFMYKGEINVSQDQIGPLLKVAETLKIRGLADVNGEQELGRTGDDGVSVSRKKRRRSSGDDSAAEDSLGESLDGRAPLELVTTSPQPPQTPQLPSHSALLSLPLPPPPPPPPPPSSTANSDEMEIKPGIAEMIREEERTAASRASLRPGWMSSFSRTTFPYEMKNLLYGTNGYSSYSKAKMLESTHAWLGASTSSLTDSYQYQLQSMWQKCWNTNQSLVHNLRFRERGPLKSWRPETMAEAILSVLKEGLSLSQAARKYDIPYPTFVLYANRVHNMLGPSADGDLRPKGRGRPQRILLGIWPEDHIRGVIRAVVFRDPQHIKEETINLSYPRIHEAINYSTSGGNPGGAGGPVNLASTMGANMGGAMGANLAMGGGGMPGSLGGGMGAGLAGMPGMGGGGSNMPGGGSDAGGVSPNTAAAAMVAVAQGLRQQMLAAHHHHGGGDHHLPPAPSYIPSNHLLPTHSPLASPVDSSPTSSPNTNIDKHNYNLSSQQQEKMDSRCLKNSLADWVALKANMAMGYKQVLNDNVNTARADHLFQDEIEDLVKRPQSNDSTKSKMGGGVGMGYKPIPMVTDLSTNRAEHLFQEDMQSIMKRVQQPETPKLKVSMGVSGVPYKSDCQGYTTAPPRTESLFQDSEIEDLVKSPQPSQPKEQPIHIPTIDQRTE